MRGAPAVELLQVRVDLAVDRGAETTRSLGAAAADAMMHRLAGSVSSISCKRQETAHTSLEQVEYKVRLVPFEGAGANKSM